MTRPTLFSPEADAWAAEQRRDKTPSWYTPEKRGPRKNANVARGLHPMGLHLADNGETCGTCAHLRRRSVSKTYMKCDITKMSRSEATDIRAKWRACEKWRLP